MISRRKLLALPIALIASCNRSENTLRLPGLPRPKFWLGQQVCHQWKSDDIYDPKCGTTYRDYGFVVGMVFEPPDYRDGGWVYWVKWINLESPASVALPFVDSVREKQLIC